MAVDGGLHRVVLGRAAGLAAEDRADVDDAAAVSAVAGGGGREIRQRGAGRAHRGHQIEIEHLLPDVIVVAADRDAHVVHDDLQLAEGSHRAGDYEVGGVGFTEVGDDAVDAAGALGGDRLHRGGQRPGASRADRNIRPLGGERTGAIEADALGGAGDQRRFAGQAQVHRSPPARRRGSFERAPVYGQAGTRRNLDA